MTRIYSSIIYIIIVSEECHSDAAFLLFSFLIGWIFLPKMMIYNGKESDKQRHGHHIDEWKTG